MRQLICLLHNLCGCLSGHFHFRNILVEEHEENILVEEQGEEGTGKTISC